MKAGWCDFRYIANRPQHFRPPHNRHRLVTPGAALRSKLGYEQYRKHSPERTEAASENASDEAHKRPKTVLADKIGYDQFRPDVDAAEVADSLPAEHAKTRKRRLSRAVHNHGLGANRAEIVANCEQFASRNVLALSIIFSPDPGLLAVVDASGSDPQLFNQHCVEAFIPNVFSELGWGNAVEYAYVTHDKPDRLGRSRLHNHITAPGSVADPETGKRRPLPYIKQTDIQQMQAIADRTVEQQLDLTLGREWRLQVPEYVHTYDELRQEVVVDNAPDMPVVVSESVPPRPRDLFSSELDSALNTMLEELPDAPTLLFDARDLEFDSFGDAELLAGLVADLFGDDFLPPMMPIQSAAALPAESNKTDESNADEHVIVPDLPQERSKLTAPVSKMEVLVEHQNMAILAEGAMPPSSAVESDAVYPWRYTLSKSEDVAYRILPNWDAETGEGRLDLEVSWYVPTAKGWSTVRQNIFHNTPLDYLRLDEGPADSAAARQEAEMRFQEKASQYQAPPEDDFNEVMYLGFEDWTHTTALDAKAKADGFLPYFPVDRLPFDPAEEAAFVDPLPEGVTWLGPAPIEDNALQWGIITRPDWEGSLRVYAIKQWLDEHETSHFTSSEIGLAAETIEDQIVSITSVQQASVKELGPTLFALQGMSEKLGHPSIDFLAEGPPHSFFTLSQPDQSLPSESELFDEDDIEELNHEDDDEIGENELDDDEQSLELDDEWDTE